VSWVSGLTVRYVRAHTHTDTHTHTKHRSVGLCPLWMINTQTWIPHPPTFPSSRPLVIPHIQHPPSHNAVVHQIHGNAIQSLCTVWKTIQCTNTLTYWQCLSMISLPYYVINTLALTWFVLCTVFRWVCVGMLVLNRISWLCLINNSNSPSGDLLYARTSLHKLVSASRPR